MRHPLNLWAPLLLSTLLLSLAACGAPDLIVTAAGLPPETRWIDIDLVQLSGLAVKQQSRSSRQLIDVAAKGEATFYKVGLNNLDREQTYAIFVAAFGDDGTGKPCLLNTAQALQDPGWVLVGDILVPFFVESALPAGACFQPPNASARWPTEAPFIASVSLATTAFDGKAPSDIPALRIRGWNFMFDDVISVLFYLPQVTPVVKSRVSSPEWIDWSVTEAAGAKLTVQDITVERADHSARHTVTLNVDLPNLF
jgi:hypothetical protein